MQKCNISGVSFGRNRCVCENKNKISIKIKVIANL